MGIRGAFKVSHITGETFQARFSTVPSFTRAANRIWDFNGDTPIYVSKDAPVWSKEMSWKVFLSGCYWLDLRISCGGRLHLRPCQAHWVPLWRQDIYAIMHKAWAWFEVLRQRSKISWLRLGDCNSKFFSLATKVRRAQDSTSWLLSSDGTPSHTRR